MIRRPWAELGTDPVRGESVGRNRIARSGKDAVGRVTSTRLLLPRNYPLLSTVVFFAGAERPTLGGAIQQ